MVDGSALLLLIALAAAVLAAATLVGVRRRRPAPSHRADTWAPRADRAAPPHR